MSITTPTALPIAIRVPFETTFSCKAKLSIAENSVVPIFCFASTWKLFFSKTRLKKAFVFRFDFAAMTRSSRL